MAMNHNLHSRDPHDPYYDPRDPCYDSEHTPNSSLILATIRALGYLVYILLSVIALALFTALLFSLNASAQDIPLARTVGRVVVTHCYMQNPATPVVIVRESAEDASTADDLLGPTPFAEVEVDADPPTPDVGCRVIDSHVQPAQISGTLMTWLVDGRVDQVMYTVSIDDGANRYRFADWASAIDWTPNGARYTVASSLLLDEQGGALEYDVTFLRRAPMDYRTWVEGFGEAILPVYDPVTIINFHRVTPDGFISVIADYRD